MPKWKQWLKGVYDTEGNKPSLIVTGSARIDSYKKVGVSLAGRYLSLSNASLGCQRNCADEITSVGL